MFFSSEIVPGNSWLRTTGGLLAAGLPIERLSEGNGLTPVRAPGQDPPQPLLSNFLPNLPGISLFPRDTLYSAGCPKIQKEGDHYTQGEVLSASNARESWDPGMTLMPLTPYHWGPTSCCKAVGKVSDLLDVSTCVFPNLQDFLSLGFNRIPDPKQFDQKMNREQYLNFFQPIIAQTHTSYFRESGL